MLLIRSLQNILCGIIQQNHCYHPTISQKADLGSHKASLTRELSHACRSKIFHPKLVWDQCRLGSILKINLPERANSRSR